MRLPTANHNDSPALTVSINQEWVGYVLGALEALNRDSVWDGTPEQVESVRQRVEQLMRAVALGSEVVNVVEVPIGGIISFYGELNDSRFALCDGGLLLIDDYPQLEPLPFVRIYDSQTGSTYLQMPDMRGRFALGKNDSYVLGSTGGYEEITLTIDQIPPHTHGIRINATAYASTNGQIARGDGAAAEGTRTSQNTGGGLPHSNMPPYLAINFYIRVQ